LKPEFDIFSITNTKQFDKIALQVFRYQYQNNLVYKQFCNLLKTDIGAIKSVDKIPFLPIQFFKTHKVVTGSDSVQEIFSSSGTTNAAVTSQHFVTDTKLYQDSYSKGFSQFYGNIQDYVFLALLPSYQERSGSSLIYMVEDLIKKTNNPNSGFYLYNHHDLLLKINQLQSENKNIILIGVTFALLDLVQSLENHNNLYPNKKLSLQNVIIMETGGMKGRRKEIIREELHQILCDGLGVSIIHSEYGMTELLSQAYSLGNGVFECPPWMQISVREAEDAFSFLGYNKTGGINVIDLANINSCSFIATQDLGKKFKNQTFEILGRFDNSDIRGCNLMV
jgi:phenylacetate-coenzyme A ligase PaaK-like adenylate-forming protein